MNIIDIAKIAGVSTATVSRVINHSGKVKEETRERIQEVMDEYNYVPNAIARSLCMKDRFSIGVILPDIKNEFFSDVIQGITEITEQSIYNILFFNTDERNEVEHDYLKVVASERLKGLLISPVSDHDEVTAAELKHLEKSGVPVVLIDRNLEGKQFDGIFVKNFEGAYDGVQALINEGHKKIAIITGPGNSLPGKERLRGYIKAMEDNGLPVRKEYQVSGNFRIEKAYQQTGYLLSLPEPPTAVFCVNNLTSLGCLKYLTEHHLVPGKDIAVMGFDGITALNIIEYPFSAIERDARMQGREAMKLLLKKLDMIKEGENMKGDSRKVYVPYKVVLRGSEKYGR